MSSGVTQTKVYAYEVALFGEFFPRDLKAILNRITLYTESAAPMHTREIVFEHLGNHLLQAQGDEPVLLRARKEVGDGKESGWTLYSYLKPESVDPKTSLPIPAHTDTLWEVEVKTATPVNTTAPQGGQIQVNTVRSAIDAVLEVQLIMKGLLDLRRKDI
ncbi:hypothetical protein ID866_11180 [Astraeus odoratus]|nr:hypothetical protein ID866_11180 [Astraeus odoratus]